VLTLVRVQLMKEQCHGANDLTSLVFGSGEILLKHVLIFLKGTSCSVLVNNRPLPYWLHNVIFAFGGYDDRSSEAT
jgi:hypothetical protein